MVGAYPSFCSMKQMRVLPLPPGWDAGPSQGTPSSMSPVPILYTWMKRDKVGLSFLSKDTTRWQEPPTFRSGVQRNLKSNDLKSTTPPLLHLISGLFIILQNCFVTGLFWNRNCKKLTTVKMAVI